MKPFWFEEYERMNRLCRELAESPAAKFARDMELIDSPAAKFMRDIELTQSPAATFMRDMEQQRQMLEPPGYRALIEWQDKAIADAKGINDSLMANFSSLVGHYAAMQSLASVQFPNDFLPGIQRSLQAFHTPALPVIESFAAGVLGAAHNIDALHQFERTFAGQLLQRVSEVAQASEDDLDARVENLTALLGSQIARSQRGPISLEAWVQIILALLLYINGAIGARKSEEHVSKRLNDIEAQLKAMAPLEKVEQTPELRLVSAKVLRVRADSSAKADVVGKLTRNSLVRVLGQQKAWAHVEYFDYVEGKTKKGWVSRQHLQRLPAELTR